MKPKAEVFAMLVAMPPSEGYEKNARLFGAATKTTFKGTDPDD